MDVQVIISLVLVALVCSLIAALCAEKRKSPASSQVEGGIVHKRINAYQALDNQARRDNNPTEYQRADDRHIASPKTTIKQEPIRSNHQPERYASPPKNNNNNNYVSPPVHNSREEVNLNFKQPVNSQSQQGQKYNNSQPAKPGHPYAQNNHSNPPANKPSYPPQSTAPSVNKPIVATTPANRFAVTTATPTPNNKPSYTPPAPTSSNKPSFTAQPTSAPSKPTSVHTTTNYVPATNYAPAQAPAANRPGANKPTHTPVAAQVAPKPIIGGNPKINALMQWTQQCTQGYKHVNITNFTTAWKDGMAFCALIHHHKPSFDYDSLSPSNPAKNLKLAFDLAEKMGVPRLMEPEDFLVLDVPDRLSTITYLFEWSNKLNK